MYEFAVVVLLGLVTLKVVDVLTEILPTTTRFRTPLTLLVAVAGVALLDYSVFTGFGIEVRDPWLGSLFTGFIAGGLASVWAAVLAWLGEGGTHREAPAVTRGGRPRVAA